MKLFGGGSGRNRNSSPRDYDDSAKAPKKKTAPKPQKAAKGKAGTVKKPLTKKEKQKRIIITSCIVAALMIMVAAGAVWVHFNVRAPEPANDATIIDKENGDQIDVNSLLNSGDRISDLFTFVVCATDEDQTRTDAIMVATMDTKKKTINVMNIPRDTMCNNGRTGTNRKINAAYGTSKGIEQTKKEISRIMGFTPDKYVVVNFDGIAAIVDAIGGVDYEIPFRMEYDDPSQNLHIDLYAGMQHLTGKQVVEFLRWRHNNNYSMQYPTGDEGRVATQQKFLKYLAGEVFQLKNVTKVKAISDAVFKNVKTDFTAGQILWMGMQAMQIKNDNIQFFTLPGYGQMSTAGSSAAYSFFFPYQNETLKLVNQYFNPFTTAISSLDMVSGPESSSAPTYDSSPDDNYVWGDTATGTTDSSSSSGGSSDPEDSGSGSTSGGDTDSSGTEGGGTTDGSSGGTSGGETGGSSGGGDTAGGDTSGETGGTSGGESGGSSGGETGGTSGGTSGGAIDPEA